MKKISVVVTSFAAVCLLGMIYSLFPPAAPAQHAPNYIPDPCFSQFTAKSSTSISVASATTVQLVAPVAGKAVYVCSATMTIAPAATADTAQFITGTGATCGGSTVTNTGTFGNGDATTATGVAVVSLGSDGTEFSAAVASGVCIVTTGSAVSVQGIISYVQQ